MDERGDEEAEIDRLPFDHLAHIFNLITWFEDLAFPSSHWGCQITGLGLYLISSAKFASNLTSIFLWGTTRDTDKGVQLDCVCPGRECALFRWRIFSLLVGIVVICSWSHRIEWFPPRRLEFRYVGYRILPKDA